jgi:hypothetical protein
VLIITFYSIIFFRNLILCVYETYFKYNAHILHGEEKASKKTLNIEWIDALFSGFLKDKDHKRIFQYPQSLRVCKTLKMVVFSPLFTLGILFFKNFENCGDILL